MCSTCRTSLFPINIIFFSCFKRATLLGIITTIWTFVSQKPRRHRLPVSVKLSNIDSLRFSKPSRRKFCLVNEGSFQEYSILKRKIHLLTLNDLLDFYSCLSGKKANRSTEYCCCRLKKTDCLCGPYFYRFMCYAT